MDSAHPSFKGQCAPSIALIRVLGHIAGAHFCTDGTLNKTEHTN